MEKNLLLLFAKNPVKGTVKTRLAKTIGEAGALAVYKRLLAHTLHTASQVRACAKAIYVSEAPAPDAPMDWIPEEFDLKWQQGQDLGERMLQAFAAGFAAGYTRVVLIGTDCPELKPAHLQEAFKQLERVAVVVGPAVDGGYYLIGATVAVPDIFNGIRWSTATVLETTLMRLQQLQLPYCLLPTLSDIDELSDLKKFPAFGAGPAASTSG